MLHHVKSGLARICACVRRRSSDNGELFCSFGFARAQTVVSMVFGSRPNRQLLLELVVVQAGPPKQWPSLPEVLSDKERRLVQRAPDRRPCLQAVAGC